MHLCQEQLFAAAEQRPRIMITSCNHSRSIRVRGGSSSADADAGAAALMT